MAKPQQIAPGQSQIHPTPNRHPHSHPTIHTAQQDQQKTTRHVCVFIRQWVVYGIVDTQRGKFSSNELRLNICNSLNVYLI